MMQKDDFNTGLLGFLDASPTPYHATQNMAMMFENAGFTRLDEKEKFDLQAGGKYYVTRNDSSIIAFTYPKESYNYVMVGAHTDSPNFKLKPNAVIKEHGVVRLGVEPYGGMLLSPWFDRELSIAGRISYLNSQNQIEQKLIDAKKPLVMIPSLAIHLDEKANKDKTINKQTDIAAILTTNDDFTLEEFIEWQLSKEGVVDLKEIYAHELMLYDAQNAGYFGLHNDFIASARLDNLLSCYVGMLALCSVESSKPMLFVANDHEEIGSETNAGAAGSFLEDTLRRVFTDYEEYVMMLRSSLMVSADNAHAVHPAFSAKHEPNHQPKIDQGVVLKINANQRYASNATSIARFKKTASELALPLQDYVVRSDMGCGSTIGPITSAKLGIETVDVGVPTWAMHSIREVCGSEDAHQLYKILVALR